MGWAEGWVQARQLPWAGRNAGKQGDLRAAVARWHPRISCLGVEWDTVQSRGRPL